MLGGGNHPYLWYIQQSGRAGDTFVFIRDMSDETLHQFYSEALFNTGWLAGWLG